MKCTQCQGNATLFLCKRCQYELHDMLHGLVAGEPSANGQPSAGWIDYLDDAAHGQTRLGESARRSTEKGSPLMVNLRASELLTYAHSVLLEWTRDITDTTGTPHIAVYPPEFIGALPKHAIRCKYRGYTQTLALWLTEHVHAIASDQSAAICYREIKELITDIERAVNRPVAPRELGPCPATLTDNYGERRCQTKLTAQHDQREVQCWKCKTTHDVEKLIRDALDETRDWLWTAREVLDFMGLIGEPITERTWRRWRTENRIQSRNETGAEPKYLLHEVRELRDQMTRRRRGSNDINALPV